MNLTTDEVVALCNTVIRSTNSDALDLAMLDQFTSDLLADHSDRYSTKLDRYIELNQSLIADAAARHGITDEFEAAKQALGRANEVSRYLGTYHLPKTSPAPDLIPSRPIARVVEAAMVCAFCTATRMSALVLSYGTAVTFSVRLIAASWFGDFAPLQPVFELLG